MMEVELAPAGNRTIIPWIKVDQTNTFKTRSEDLFISYPSNN